jgi:hypothetical protein
MSSEDRFAGEEWARFLRDCRCTLGTNSGFDYFDLDDTVRTRVLDFLRRYPDADFERIQSEIFADQPKLLPCRLITGRHVEAAASGPPGFASWRLFRIFRARCPHIPVETDFSNLCEALEKAQTPEIAQPIADRANVLVREKLHTRHLSTA